ncbi:hypothetical protein BS78_01G108700 [Paspalum vaginatum]|nr:hypothetical protein BS78_01G108700 [Paspalum vaginatum]
MPSQQLEVRCRSLQLAQLLATAAWVVPGTSGRAAGDDGRGWVLHGGEPKPEEDGAVDAVGRAMHGACAEGVQLVLEERVLDAEVLLLQPGLGPRVLAMDGSGLGPGTALLATMALWPCCVRGHPRALCEGALRWSCTRHRRRRRWRPSLAAPESAAALGYHPVRTFGQEAPQARARAPSATRAQATAPPTTRVRARSRSRSRSPACRHREQNGAGCGWKRRRQTRRGRGGAGAGGVLAAMLLLRGGRRGAHTMAALGTYPLQSS